MAPKSKTRIDAHLVAIGLASDLRQAAGWILAGDVLVNEQRVDKVGTMISSSAQIRVKAHDQFVGRGGEKLRGAIEDLQLTSEFKDKTILDVGASTGGFTDCSLQLGAAKVYSLDVGTNQLAWELRQNPRVVAIEKTDIRDLSLGNHIKFDWVVIDVSFNSLARLAPAIQKAAPQANILALVKPQFELDKDQIPSGGIVEDDQLRKLAVDKVELAFAGLGYICLGKVDAQIAGRGGNKEIFIYLQAEKSSS